MLLEADEELRDFVTIYGKDYQPKKLTLIARPIPCDIFGNPDYYKNAFNTVYQLEFLKHPGDYVSLYKQRIGDDTSDKLPNNWIIPETMQKHSYRNPQVILGQGEKKYERAKKPPNNLDPNMKQREILKVRTGDSEYFVSIGATGEKIFREKIRRDIEPIKNYHRPPLDCSVSENNTKNVFLSNIF